MPSTNELHIAALEAQNRLLRTIVKVSFATLSLVAVLAIAGWRHPQDQVVRAKVFIALNDSGKEVASFGVTKEGTGVFKACDEKGEERVVIGTTASDQGSVEVYDDQGKERVGLGFRAGTQASLFTLDESGTIKSCFGELKDGAIGMEVYGSKRVQLSASVERDCPVVSLAKPDGEVMSYWIVNLDRFSGMSFSKQGDPNTFPPETLSINSDLGLLTHARDITDGGPIYWPPRE